MSRLPSLTLVPFLFALGGCTLSVDDRLQTPECLVDADCELTNVCEGPRRCDAMSHTCVSRNQPVNCDDTDPCTADSCDATVDGGCVNTFIDADGDGFAPAATCTTTDYAGLGGDCDDSNNGILPGGAEQCGNGIDDNCNGTTDTDAPANMTCYRDLDDDGFHNLFDTVAAGCSCPLGYIPANPSGPDCADGVADARPSQTAYSAIPYCLNASLHVSKPSVFVSGTGYVCPDDGATTYSKRWDYDCDGDDTQGLTSIANSCYILSFTTISPTIISTFALPIEKAGFCYARWDSASVSVAPACGATGAMWHCATLSTCQANSTVDTQTCR